MADPAARHMGIIRQYNPFFGNQICRRVYSHTHECSCCEAGGLQRQRERQLRFRTGSNVPLLRAAVCLGAILVVSLAGVVAKSARAVQAVTPPAIDGLIEPNEWLSATFFEDFIQFEPSSGEPAFPACSL